jgi:hypothetical protein
MDYITSLDRESFSNNPYGYSDIFVAVGDAISPVSKILSRPPAPVKTATNVNRSWIVDNSRDATFSLSYLSSSKFALRKSIALSMRQDGDGEYVMTFPAAEISRSGETPRIALDWLMVSIVDLYELYKKREHQLGPLPKRQLKALEEYLVAKPNSKSRSYIHRKKAQSGNRSKRTT